MLGPLVTIKVDSTEELACINNRIVPLLRKQEGCRNENLHTVPSVSPAIAKTSWATKEAECLCDAGNLIGLADVVEGRPLMEGFELAGDGFQKAFAKAA